MILSAVKNVQTIKKEIIVFKNILIRNVNSFPVNHFKSRFLHLIYLFWNRDILRRFKADCFYNDGYVWGTPVIVSLDLMRSMKELRSEIKKFKSLLEYSRMHDLRFFRDATPLG